VRTEAPSLLTRGKLRASHCGRNCGRGEFQRRRQLRRHLQRATLENRRGSMHSQTQTDGWPGLSLLVRVVRRQSTRASDISAHRHWRNMIFWWLLVRCLSRAGCRRRAFHPMRICQARTRIPYEIPQDTATRLFRLPQKRRLVRTHFCGVWTSSITVITGKLMRLGRGSGRWRDRDGPMRMLLRGLILLSAVGVKIRERKVRQLPVTPCAPRLCFVS
jgi:hypothetical protein